MIKSEVLQRIRGTGLIPVVRAESADLAMRAVEAIKAGGVGVLEVTMTVPGAISPACMGHIVLWKKQRWPYKRSGPGSPPWESKKSRFSLMRRSPTQDAWPVSCARWPQRMAGPGRLF